MSQPRIIQRETCFAIADYSGVIDGRYAIAEARERGGKAPQCCTKPMLERFGEKRAKSRETGRNDGEAYFEHAIVDDVGVKT